MTRADRLVGEQLHALARGHQDRVIVRDQTTRAAAHGADLQSRLADAAAVAVPLSTTAGPCFLADLSPADGLDLV
jgi:hypothetical protein